QPYVTAALHYSTTALKIRYVVTVAFVVAAQRHSATTSQHHYVLATLRHSATTSQHHYIRAPLRHSTTTSQQPFITAHYVKDSLRRYSCLCRSSPTSQRHYVTASLRHSTTTLKITAVFVVAAQRHSAITSQRHHVTAPLRLCTTTSQHHCGGISPPIGPFALPDGDDGLRLLGGKVLEPQRGSTSGWGKLKLRCAGSQLLVPC
ncbi:hypothetical protein BgiMline_026961, partial [Biomphalaria glabrata]